MDYGRGGAGGGGVEGNGASSGTAVGFEEGAPVVFPPLQDFCNHSDDTTEVFGVQQDVA